MVRQNLNRVLNYVSRLTQWAVLLGLSIPGDRRSTVLDGSNETTNPLNRWLNKTPVLELKILELESLTLTLQNWLTDYINMSGCGDAMSDLIFSWVFT
jgi:hypothetical protein